MTKRAKFAGVTSYPVGDRMARDVMDPNRAGGYADDHPLVKAHPDWFVDADDTVESATAAPGEKRSVKKPKRATKKKAAKK